MATNEVEIELKLTGAEEAVEGFQEIGETSKAMAEHFVKDNEKLGEGLGDLTGNVTDMVGSVKGLGTAFKSAGGSMMSLLGPITAVVAAGFALYETFRNITGAAQEAEDAEEAMAAAASDLQSKLEALAEKGVIPTAKELQQFTEMTIKAQFAKERLQKSMEIKVTPAMQKYNELIAEQSKLQRLVNKDSGEAGAAYIEAMKRLPELDKEIAKAQEVLSKKLAAYREDQIELEKDIARAAKQEEEFEERTNESRLAKIKENQARLEAYQLMKKQNGASEEEIKLYEIKLQKVKALFLLELERNKENDEYIKDLDERLKKEIAFLETSGRLRRTVEANAEKQQENIRKEFREKRQAEEEKENAKRLARAAAYNAKRMAIERQRLAEEKQIRALGYEQLRLDGVDQLELLEMQYKDELKEAGDNANKKLIAEMKYQNAFSRIQDQRKAEDEARAQEAIRLETERQSFIFSTMEFNNQRIEDETERQLAQLELRYEREIRLGEYAEDQITEIKRRYSIERQEIEKASIDAQIEKVGEFTSMYSAGLAEAAYNSLLFGESFQESVGEMLVALGRQAAVESLMETAKGTAALFLPGGQALAAGHFKAAGLFAGAAAVAGTAGKALGGGSSGGVGSGGDTSPTGTPQTAPTPQREQADTQAMVFNINFGGAVIYDTQRAAEQALADRITNLQNTRRRGAPRRSM